ncbi:hypothetical protein PG991_008801 [Apiospora marii]|uniref:Tubulin-specific chaperone A n=1 Tax=Apiospora marii TaxID=335849 RepID=A0ABR1RLU7_9PEZI
MASEENLRGPEMKELEDSFARLDTTPEAGQPSTQDHSMETQHAEGRSREVEKKSEKHSKDDINSNRPDQQACLFHQRKKTPHTPTIYIIHHLLFITMAFGKKTQQITVEELEQRFAKLSLKVENAQAVAKASAGYQHEPPMVMPKLRRQDTREECIEKIDQLIELCEEVQTKIQDKVERWEAESTRSNLSQLLDVVIGCL